MKLSNQAIGALMLTLQKCLAEQADMTELLSDWELDVQNSEVVVLNPPGVAVKDDKPEKKHFITE
jgi:hypothetical protein